MSPDMLIRSAIVSAIVLVRITAILFGAWLIYAVIRGRNPRWSILLWRTVMVAVVFVAILSPFVRGWGPKVGLPAYAAVPLISAGLASMNGTETPVGGVIDATQRRQPEISSGLEPAPAKSTMSASQHRANTDVPDEARAFSLLVWRIAEGIFGCYIAGIIFGMFRLQNQFVRLKRLFNESEAGNEQLRSLVTKVAGDIGLRMVPEVRTSDRVAGPFASGMIRPTIVFPSQFMTQVTERELQFITAHECSHFAGRDLYWAFAAQLLRISLWFHPFVWRLPNAHNFACDVRCDGVASGDDRFSYAQMLARLVLAIRPQRNSPVSIAFFCGAQIVRRIESIDKGIAIGLPARNRRIVAGIALAVTFIICGTLFVNPYSKSFGMWRTTRAESRTVKVKVVDKNGNPINRAEVVAWGLRTKKEPAGGYGNPSGKIVTTDLRGIAEVPYARYVFEEMETAKLILTTTHSDYAPSQEEYSVDTPIIVTLVEGRRIHVNPTNSAPTGKRASELVMELPEPLRSMSLRQLDDRSYISNVVDAGIRSIRLVSIVDERPWSFSDPIDLGGDPNMDVQLADIQMKPTRTIACRLEGNVPRPVANGFAFLVVRASATDAANLQDQLIWSDYTTIDDDGGFEFDHIPPEGLIDLIAVCDGWVSKTATNEDIKIRYPKQTFWHSQAGNLVFSRPMKPSQGQIIELEMEPAAKIDVTVVDANGDPISDVKIAACPNAVPHSVVGMCNRTLIGLGKTDHEIQAMREQIIRDLEQDKAAKARELYFAKTDANGKASIPNIHGKKHIPITVEHESYELPATPRNPFSRNTFVDLVSGETTEVRYSLQPKGLQVLGR